MKDGIFAAGGWALGTGGALPVRAGAFNGKEAPRFLFENRTVRIPSDYDTLQEALNGESKWHVVQGVGITILIEAGHKLTQNLVITGGDYSYFHIRSVDEVVGLESDMVFKTNPTDGVTCLFDCHHCRAPVLDCLIDMARIGRRGYRLFSAHGIILRGGGIRNAGEDGIDCGHGSTIWIRGGEATGCGRHNLHVSHGSTCSARTGGRSNFSGATGDFDHPAAGTNVAFAHGAIGTIANADCRDAALDGIGVKHGSVIDAHLVDASNAGRDGVRAGDGATVNIRTSNLRKAGRHAISARHAATIQARGCDARESGVAAVVAGETSRIDAGDVNATGSKGGNGDIVVRRGGIINAANALGLLSQRANQITSDGIVFQ